MEVSSSHFCKMKLLFCLRVFYVERIKISNDLNEFFSQVASLFPIHFTKSSFDLLHNKYGMFIEIIEFTYHIFEFFLQECCFSSEI